MATLGFCWPHFYFVVCSPPHRHLDLRCGEWECDSEDYYSMGGSQNEVRANFRFRKFPEVFPKQESGK